MGTTDSIASLTRPARTGGYTPSVMGQQLGIALDGRPRFTWLEAERMRLDPQIQFGLRILRAPLFGATFKVQADSPALQAWVDREFKRVYRQMLPHLVRYYEYGVAGGEVTFRQARSRATGRTRIHFDAFHEFHPRDVRPLVFDRGRRAGKLAGLHVSGVRGGNLYLDRRHGFFFKGEAEYGAWWGRPRMAGPYEPWVEKRGRHGAVPSRQLFYKKGAFRGPRIRYPIGRTDMGGPDSGPVWVSNQDIARELVEKFENGGVLALPNVKIDGGYAWEWEDPESFADASGLLDYPKQLDREILLGFGIPPELVEASTVGSGYSGRAIPAQVFFTSMDEVVTLIAQAIDEQIIKFLVRLNFGKGAGYEIVPDSLAQLVAQTPPNGQGGGGPPGGAQPQPGAGGLVPYQGPHGGVGMRDPATGRVHYGKPHQQEQSYTRLSLNASDPNIAPDPRTLWEECAAPVCEATPGITVWRDPKKVPAVERRLNRLRLSWSPFNGPRGGHGWVSDTGQVRYQQAQPGDHEADPAAGPESVFAHPDFAHLAHAGAEPDYAARRASYEAAAREHGTAPADLPDLHRRAAAHLEGQLARTTSDPNRDFAPPEQLRAHLARHTAAADAIERNPHLHDLSDPKNAGLKGYVADTRRRVAEFDARGGAARPVDKGALLDAAYSDAHEEQRRDRAEQNRAAAFADTYFDHETAADRARHYIEAATDGDLDPERLDPDTRDAVADDLAHLPPEELAAHAAHVFDQYGHADPDGGLYPHAALAARAVDAAAERLKEEGRAPRPVPFDAGEPGDLFVAHRDDFNDDQWAGVQAAARLAPASRAQFLDPERALVYPAGGPLAEALADGGADGDAHPLDGDGARHALFNSLTSGFQVPQDAVPASAKDYGGTSGSKGSGEFRPEADWNPHHADVYRRVSDGWYLARTSDASGEDGWYRFVRAQDAPPLSRLPDPYWEHFDPAAEPTYDADAVGRTEVRGAKAGREGAAQKREIREQGGAREYTKAAQRYRGEHARTGNLVRSDDALRDRLQALGGEYDFADGAGMAREADAPTREKLDALEDALQGLRDADHGHEYDPDAVGEFDASQLTAADDSRADTAGYARDTAAQFDEWEDAAGDTVRDARDAALGESARFRGAGAGPLLRAARAAAQAVVGLPTGAIDADAREAAREVAQRALQLHARARRSVKLSLNAGAAG